MRLQKHFSIVLLSYLVLCWNLGSSLHRAHFLDGQEENGVVAVETACHCAFHLAKQTDEANYLLYSDEDCQFCKFFHQFNVTISTWQLPNTSEFLSFVAEIPVSWVDGKSVFCWARGPPKS